MSDEFRVWGHEEGYKFDRFAHAVTVMDEPHRLIHDGMMYFASGRVTGVANGASVDILIGVPAGVRPHVQDCLFYMGDSPGSVFFYEDVTTSNDGTAQTPRNRNRNSPRTPGVAVSQGPTVTGTGTLLRDTFVPDVGGGAGPFATAGGVEAGDFNNEWILKPNTKYMFRCTNNSGGAITVGWELLWYELAYSV